MENQVSPIVRKKSQRAFLVSLLCLVGVGIIWALFYLNVLRKNSENVLSEVVESSAIEVPPPVVENFSFTDPIVPVVEPSVETVSARAAAPKHMSSIEIKALIKKGDFRGARIEIERQPDVKVRKALETILEDARKEWATVVKEIQILHANLVKIEKDTSMNAADQRQALEHGFFEIGRESRYPKMFRETFAVFADASGRQDALQLMLDSASKRRERALEAVANSGEVIRGELTNVAKLKIGKKIWQNESAGKVSGLTAWNKGEGFPSLGIGHFIWYPAGVRGPFTESWPQFIIFAKEQNVKPPKVALSPRCPWRNRSEFQKKFNGAEMKNLRSWLAKNISLQTEFIIRKSRAALPKILSHARATGKDARLIQRNYDRVATTANGTYALIDYVNFKGEGVNSKEQYKEQGWGLMQVLLEMKSGGVGQSAARDFARAAQFCLDRRIRNSPPARGEKRWKKGWYNRCETYVRAF